MAEQPAIGLICAIPQELAELRAALDHDVREEIGGFAFDRGRLDGRMGLLASLDLLRRDMDTNGSIDGMDTFCRRAFDLPERGPYGREHPVEAFWPDVGLGPTFRRLCLANDRAVGRNQFAVARDEIQATPNRLG